MGGNNYDPLVIEDFDWGNEWVDPTIPPPQGARGCPDDISWELVDEARHCKVATFLELAPWQGGPQMLMSSTKGSAKGLLRHQHFCIKMTKRMTKNNNQVSPMERMMIQTFFKMMLM